MQLLGVLPVLGGTHGSSSVAADASGSFWRIVAAAGAGGGGRAACLQQGLEPSGQRCRHVFLGCQQQALLRQADAGRALLQGRLQLVRAGAAGCACHAGVGIRVQEAVDKVGHGGTLPPRVWQPGARRVARPVGCCRLLRSSLGALRVHALVKRGGVLGCRPAGHARQRSRGAGVAVCMQQGHQG